MANARSITYNGQKAVLYPNGVIKSGGHRNWRNNNPGNISAGSFSNNHGAIGSDGRFAIYNDMDSGYQAQSDLLQSSNYSNLSMNDAVYRYAPPSENDSAGYVRYITQKTGIDPNKKMSDLTNEERDAMVKAMAQHEGLENGTGDVIEGATVDGNQATGGQKTTDDPFAGSGSGGGGTPGSADPCLDTGSGQGSSGDSQVDKLAQIEGNGKYTQGEDNQKYSSASGRYQFMASTAEAELIATGLAKNQQEASDLWHECKSSASAKCQGVQDTIAKHYSDYNISDLTYSDQTVDTVYMRWNQGKGGANQIQKAYDNGTMITDPALIYNMDQQAWSKRYGASNGDPKIFKANMRKYIHTQGVDPDSHY